MLKTSWSCFKCEGTIALCDRHFVIFPGVCPHSVRVVVVDVVVVVVVAAVKYCFFFAVISFNVTITGWLQ